jgi:hypothetical protein
MMQFLQTDAYRVLEGKVIHIYFSTSSITCATAVSVSEIWCYYTSHVVLYVVTDIPSAI